MSIPNQRLYAPEDENILAENSFSQASISQTPVVDACQPSEDCLALCAYFIWLSEGCPHGKNREHWIQAEEQLRQCCRYDRIHDPVSA